MNILVVEKPESITYDQIHRLLWEANEQNRRSGFHLRTAELSGIELEKRIGKNGKCFVAMDGTKLIGTISVRLVERNTWYFKGLLPDYILAGVLPEYQGMHVNSMLAAKVFEFAGNNDFDAIELDTATNNLHAINVYKHQGFKIVDYVIHPELDHDSVVMIKWLRKHKQNRFYAFTVCTCKRIKSKILRFCR